MRAARPEPPRLGPGRTFDRRTLLRGASLGLSTIAVVALSGCSLFDSRGSISTVGQVDFATALRIPPLADSHLQEGVRSFDLTLQSGSTEIVDQGATDTWGVNGPLLGPTVRVHRDQTVRMDVRNELDEATSLHWHGMRLPAAADGGPHQMIDPGGTWSPSWRIDQPAATLWYHPHPHGRTESHVYRGLGGMIIIDDDHEASLELPRRYGIDDIPVIVQDKTFDADGALVEGDREDVGLLGETILVNGTAGPRFEATAERTRLRLLNASTARSYAFGFDGDRPFHMIASDGGLLPAPVELTRLTLTPGERAEIVIELAGSESTVLRSFPQELGVSTRIAERSGAGDTLDILRIDAAQTLDASPALPARLVDDLTVDVDAAHQQRRFELGDNRINGRRMDMGLFPYEGVGPAGASVPG